LNYLYLDASALVKKYVAEQGSLMIHAIFKQMAMDRLMGLHLGIGECISVMVRRKNAGMISLNTYAHAMLKLNVEILNSSDFRLLPVDDQTIFESFSFIEKYSLNATDAVVLESALRQQQALNLNGHDLILLVSDVRLLNSAQAEGLTTFNPETASEQDLANIL
jgi:predicted nucleic acid-binding protein